MGIGRSSQAYQQMRPAMDNCVTVVTGLGDLKGGCLALTPHHHLGRFLSRGCIDFLEDFSALFALSVAVDEAALVQSRPLRRQTQTSGQAVAQAGEWLV